MRRVAKGNQGQKISENVSLKTTGNLKKEAVDFKSHCLSGAATCTMDLMSTQEFKKQKVQEQLEPHALNPRAGDGVRLKWGGVVNP